MDLRHFFTNHHWWGKLIGAFLGYLMAGPSGALFGILIGNVFDRGLTTHFSKPHWPYHEEKRKTVKHLFIETTFSVMGHIAKTNGRVSESVIAMVKTIMQEMELNATQKKMAEACFTKGKNPHFNLIAALTLFKQASHDHTALIKLFIELQYRVAKVDGLTTKKQHMLNYIFSQMGFAPLNQQSRFYEDFFHDSTYRESRQQYSSSSSNQRRYHTPPNLLDHAYGLLEVSPTTSQKDVKNAYRRLMSKNHPDKLIAQGLPEETIKKANEKTQKIRKAYEQICANKGW